MSMTGKGIEEALRIVIEHLDNQMRDKPSRELADVSNYLEDELARVIDGTTDNRN